jgi:hypothetical protein
MKRSLTETEKMVISRMAETLPDSKRSQIVADLARASAEPMNDDGTIIRFEIPEYQRPPQTGGRVTVDGKVKDRDGAHLDVILFTDENDRLYELEVVRYEVGKVMEPDWTTLTFY